MSVYTEKWVKQICLIQRILNFSDSDSSIKKTKRTWKDPLSVLFLLKSLTVGHCGQWNLIKAAGNTPLGFTTPVRFLLRTLLDTLLRTGPLRLRHPNLNERKNNTKQKSPSLEKKKVLLAYFTNTFFSFLKHFGYVTLFYFTTSYFHSVSHPIYCGPLPPSQKCCACFADVPRIVRGGKSWSTTHWQWIGAPYTDGSAACKTVNIAPQQRYKLPRLVRMS